MLRSKQLAPNLQNGQSEAQAACLIPARLPCTSATKIDRHPENNLRRDPRQSMLAVSQMRIQKKLVRLKSQNICRMVSSATSHERQTLPDCVCFALPTKAATRSCVFARKLT